MSHSPLDILIVGDDVEEAKRALLRTDGHPFEVEHTRTLAGAISRLPGSISLVLVDLTLPDASGLEAIRRLSNEAPDVPIVVLTRAEDQEGDLQCLRHGAQDYLVKGRETDPSALLMRAIRCALQRHQMSQEIRKLSLEDPLTGPYHRRSFFTIANQQLKLSQRNATEFTIIFADLDRLKSINDTHGHREGDRAIVETARVLKSTFRESDTVARVGGDEFMVLCMQASREYLNAITSRLQRNLEASNARNGHKYLLSLSVGSACFDPSHPRTIEELAAEADSHLYLNKRMKRPPLPGSLARRIDQPLG